MIQVDEGRVISTVGTTLWIGKHARTCFVLESCHRHYIYQHAWLNSIWLEHSCNIYRAWAQSCYIYAASTTACPYFLCTFFVLNVLAIYIRVEIELMEAVKSIANWILFSSMSCSTSSGIIKKFVSRQSKKVVKVSGPLDARVKKLNDFSFIKVYIYT